MTSRKTRMALPSPECSSPIPASSTSPSPKTTVALTSSRPCLQPPTAPIRWCAPFTSCSTANPANRLTQSFMSSCVTFLVVRAKKMYRRRVTSSRSLQRSCKSSCASSSNYRPTNLNLVTRESHPLLKANKMSTPNNSRTTPQAPRNSPPVLDVTLNTGNTGRRILWASLLAVLCLGLFLPVLSLAQVSGGSITGTVTDPTGAVIPGAMVTIVNRGTGVVQTVKATSTGLFNKPNLDPGNYDVTIQAKGFSSVNTEATVDVGHDTVLLMT